MQSLQTVLIRLPLDRWGKGFGVLTVDTDDAGKNDSLLSKWAIFLCCRILTDNLLIELELIKPYEYDQGRSS
jgi:hypothetical protein